MTVAAPPSTVQPTPNFRPIRLETLVWLRWLAVGGQIVAVLFVEFVLGYPTPLAPCLALIGLSVVMNLFFIFRYGAGDRLRPEVAAFQLAYDCLQLGALLALTGGLQNPFSLLLLAPISVSATTLPQRATVYLVILVAVIASILSVWHMPLPWKPGTRLVFDRLYVVGIWVALLCGMVFIATYINR
ncbi:MAG: sensor histidine kinase, partial [Devosia nanyangense]|nr:sensor histidine kinase [Devosia nanyangense]